VNDGATIPDVNVTVGEESVSLASLGAPLVVYFYPKDDTSGCTREAVDFTALAADFAAAGVRVVGISRDSPASHAKFAAKHALTVDLASDESGAACEAFGVWGEKQMYGRSYMGIERATFLFDRTGRLARQWRKVRVPGHAAAVLAAARELPPT
jgi:thioredoxin-dependent peroxiredoxin